MDSTNPASRLLSPPRPLSLSINNLASAFDTLTMAADDKNKSHIARLKPYDGNRAEWLSFICSVELYFLANSDDFKDEQKKALFALSYMQGGTAGLFANDYVEQRLADNTWPKWAEFKKLLLDRFSDQESKRHAQQKLAQMRPGTRNLQEFFVEFEQLARYANYTTDVFDSHKITLLEQNLPRRIIDLVYTMEKIPSKYTEFRYKCIS